VGFSIQTNMKPHNQLAIQEISMRFETLVAVKTPMTVLLFVRSCGLIGGYQRFGSSAISQTRRPSSPRSDISIVGNSVQRNKTNI
jgi:hypothetical protein